MALSLRSHSEPSVKITTRPVKKKHGGAAPPLPPAPHPSLLPASGGLHSLRGTAGSFVEVPKVVVETRWVKLEERLAALESQVQVLKVLCGKPAVQPPQVPLPGAPDSWSSDADTEIEEVPTLEAVDAVEEQSPVVAPGATVEPPAPVEKVEMDVDIQPRPVLSKHHSRKSRMATSYKNDIELTGSVWDAFLLACVGNKEGMTRAERFFTALLFVVNVFLQVLFLLAISTTIAKKSYDEDFQFSVLNQRLASHSYAAVDFANLQSKIQNVCRNRHLNRLSDALEDVQTYLRRGEEEGGIPGSVISVIAMLIWTLSVLRELRRTVLLIQTLLVLDRPYETGPSEIVVNSPDGQTTVIVTQLGACRKGLVIVLAMIPRLGTAVTLLGYGLFFLATTSNVTDLVLNACALEIVKDIDELLFEALFSRHCHTTVLSTKIRPSSFMMERHPIVAPENSSAEAGTRGAMAQGSMYMRMIIVVGVLAASIHFFLQPVLEETEAVLYRVCGGNLDWSYVEHPLAKLPFFAEVSPDDEATWPLQCFYAAQQEMLNARAGFSKPIFTQELENSEAVRQLRSEDPRCRDPASVNSKSGKGGNSTADLNCPNARLSQVKEMLGSTSFRAHPLCRDEDVMYTFLRYTCIYGRSSEGPFINRFPAAELLRNRTSCSQVADLCDCEPDFDGLCREPPSKPIDGYTWNNDFRNVLRGICGQTCGLCKR